MAGGGWFFEEDASGHWGSKATGRRERATGVGMNDCNAEPAAVCWMRTGDTDAERRVTALG